MSLLDDAIRKRKEIIFTYNGLSRVVQPATHGIHASSSNEVLRGYQVGGSSSSSQLPKWKLFDVSKIQHLQETGETFSSNPPCYKMGDSAMKIIYAELI